MIVITSSILEDIKSVLPIYDHISVALKDGSDITLYTDGYGSVYHLGKTSIEYVNGIYLHPAPLNSWWIANDGKSYIRMHDGDKTVGMSILTLSL